jgi:hypothetical protein
MEYRAISMLVENGTEGYSGDGRKSTAAQLDGPNGAAVDSAGKFQ